LILLLDLKNLHGKYLLIKLVMEFRKKTIKLLINYLIGVFRKNLDAYLNIFNV